MPTCNSAAWVSDSVKSVLSQSHTQLELIVVDDGSSDHTVALLKKMRETDERLNIIERNSCSGGPPTPRNDGIDVAKGNYLAFIDSDDLWHSRKLALQLDSMEKFGLNFLSTQHIPFHSSPPETTNVDDPYQIRFRSHSNLIRKNWVVTSSALIEASLFKRTRFNQQPEYIGVEDYLTWLQLHQNPIIKSGVLTQPLVLYRVRRDSISASKTRMAKKIFYLLSRYTYRGQPLGIRKHLYFATYVFFAFKGRLFS